MHVIYHEMLLKLNIYSRSQMRSLKDDMLLPGLQATSVLWYHVNLRLIKLFGKILPRPHPLSSLKGRDKLFLS